MCGGARHPWLHPSSSWTAASWFWLQTQGNAQMGAGGWGDGAEGPDRQGWCPWAEGTFLRWRAQRPPLRKQEIKKAKTSERCPAKKIYKTFFSSCSCERRTGITENLGTDRLGSNLPKPPQLRGPRRSQTISRPQFPLLLNAPPSLGPLQGAQELTSVRHTVRVTDGG